MAKLVMSLNLRKQQQEKLFRGYNLSHVVVFSELRKNGRKVNEIECRRAEPVAQEY